ncbi:class I SAM-dependent methyltransferase [Clostridium formicaceticum]|uniref:Demethylmenaquinone methyltransferase n=1 Tax=Clostridium formicaceticum TaxID=1497 RepID=A0AAC9WGY5_9CLOT|nr:class I SAM-dependent methyltransferase [Clostridium formicaceticum]ARE88289.1 Demethylmenaquinone methyltransferase [Clostridium formicaceticum]
MIQQDKYWNKVASEKEFTTPFKLDLFEDHVEKNSKILDYGCGYGRTLDLLRKNGYLDLFGVDLSEKMIERAKEENPSMQYKVIKQNKLGFEDNSFDAVLLLAVLTCVINNEEQEMIMQEIKRVLKPSGVIYINDFLLNDDERNINRYNKFKDKYNCYGVFELDEGAILRHYDEKRIEELTKDFHTLGYEKVVYTTMNGNKSNGFNYIGKI